MRNIGKNKIQVQFLLYFCINKQTISFVESQFDATFARMVQQHTDLIFYLPMK